MATLGQQPSTSDAELTNDRFSHTHLLRVLGFACEIGHRPVQSFLEDLSSALDVAAVCRAVHPDAVGSSIGIGQHVSVSGRNCSQRVGRGD